MLWNSGVSDFPSHICISQICEYISHILGFSKGESLSILMHMCEMRGAQDADVLNVIFPWLLARSPFPVYCVGARGIVRSVCACAGRVGSERTSPWELGAAPSFINQRPLRHTPRLSHLTASDGDAALGGVPPLEPRRPSRTRVRGMVGVWVRTHHAPPSPSYWAESQYSKLPSADKKKWAGLQYGGKKGIVKKRWHIDCLVCVSCGPVVRSLPLLYKCRSRGTEQVEGRRNWNAMLDWRVRSQTGRPDQQTHKHKGLARADEKVKSVSCTQRSKMSSRHPSLLFFALFVLYHPPPLVSCMS